MHVKYIVLELKSHGAECPSRFKNRISIHQLSNNSIFLIKFIILKYFYQSRIDIARHDLSEIYSQPILDSTMSCNQHRFSIFL